MKTYISELKTRLGVTNNPYFTALRDGSLSREDFLETQAQFFFAVVFFSRPMAALAGRLPRPELRLELLHNVWDEHGEGSLTLTHEKTFIQLLGRLGYDPAELERIALWPEVRAFNTTLSAACAMDDTNTAMAMLGIIEDLFSGISTLLGQGIVARGWLPAEQVVHYAVHEKLDVEHAEGFYKDLYAAYQNHPRHRYQIEQGLELGAYVFLRMYEDLFRARGRRWRRTVRGPHSLADGWYLDDAP